MNDLNILNKIKIMKVFYDLNISFKNMHFAVKYLNQQSNDYNKILNNSQFQKGRSFYIIYNCLNKFKANLNNFFIEQFIKTLKKKFNFTKKQIIELIKKLKNNINKKKGKIFICEMFINKSNLYRKIFVRKSRGNFSYNKKNFINLYIIFKYQQLL